MTAKRKPERRGITWVALVAVCKAYSKAYTVDCEMSGNDEMRCAEVNCPIWKRLPKVDT